MINNFIHFLTGDTFNDVKTECSTGQGSLATVYETVKRLKENKETESKCGDRTGPLYASVWSVRNKDYGSAVQFLSPALGIEKNPNAMQTGFRVFVIFIVILCL